MLRDFVNPENAESFQVSILQLQPVIITLQNDGQIQIPDVQPWQCFDKIWPRRKNWTSCCLPTTIIRMMLVVVVHYSLLFCVGATRLKRMLLFYGFFEQAIDETKAGFEQAADDDDALVCSYLSARLQTLQKLFDRDSPS
jgi:hypothetical protein